MSKKINKPYLSEENTCKKERNYMVSMMVFEAMQCVEKKLLSYIKILHKRTIQSCFLLMKKRIEVHVHVCIPTSFAHINMKENILRNNVQSLRPT